MRTPEEMFNLILDTAHNDERIRAVILNGSRANSAAPGDIWQDFDIIYVVRSIAQFREDAGWFARFGEIMVMQRPDDMDEPPAGPQDAFACLMQFVDGNRIDLTLYPLEKIAELRHDSLSVSLLDKDQLLHALPSPDERDYLPQPPTERQFFNCCNEFWWVAPYVAKGIWRQQPTYAHAILDGTLRNELIKMLTWQIGLQTGFQKNPGKDGKYFQQYLAHAEWNLLLETYAGADLLATHHALMAICSLFRHSAHIIATHYHYSYPEQDDERVSLYISQGIRNFRFYSLRRDIP
jgi:aminoglycoside 6-adenylyltransferase